MYYTDQLRQLGGRGRGVVVLYVFFSLVLDGNSDVRPFNFESETFFPPHFPKEKQTLTFWVSGVVLCRWNSWNHFGCGINENLIKQTGTHACLPAPPTPRLHPQLRASHVCLRLLVPVVVVVLVFFASEMRAKGEKEREKNRVSERCPFFFSPAFGYRLRHARLVGRSSSGVALAGMLAYQQIRRRAPARARGSCPVSRLSVRCLTRRRRPLNSKRWTANATFFFFFSPYLVWVKLLTTTQSCVHITYSTAPCRRLRALVFV